MKKAKTTGQLIKQLQPIFNKYIRLRDKDKPCISCGEYFDFDETDCGHFYAKSGYSGLRFEEDNCAKECRKCNRFDESHLIGYAENLKAKIGETDYKELKLKAQDYKANGKKWSRHELREMIDYYKAKVKELE
jgi:hypothetical protein